MQFARRLLPVVLLGGLVSPPSQAESSSSSRYEPSVLLGLGVGAANLTGSSGPDFLWEPTLGFFYTNVRSTRMATRGFGLKANAQLSGESPRYGLGVEGFIQHVGADLGVVWERNPHGGDGPLLRPKSGATLWGVEGTAFLTYGRLLSLYGRTALVPGSPQALRTDAGFQLMLRWQDLEKIAEIIEFFTP